MKHTWQESNYDYKIGWFYNQPDWHEVVVKYMFLNDISGKELFIMLDWIKNTCDDMNNNVIWRDTKNHLKVKFKDFEQAEKFKARWAKNWIPENKQLKYNFNLTNGFDYEKLITILQEKMGQQSVDWDFGQSGLWFKKYTDITKIQLLIRAREKNQAIVRPISKSLVHEKKEFNHRISLDFLPPDNNTFLTPYGRFYSITLPGFSDYRRQMARIVEWCDEFLEKDSWRIKNDYIYFSNSDDILFFILRWQ